MFKIWCLLLAIGLCHARYVVQPKFYAEDSAVIVDTDKTWPKPLPSGIQDFRSKFHPIQAYPTYHILPPMQRIPPKFTPVPSTTTAAVPTASPNFQNELFAIAKEKLGLKRRDEVPSITELGELLGTSSDDETMKYIRHLTTTDQGIALIKAYLESTDYTDNADTIEEPQPKMKMQTPVTTPKPTISTTTTAATTMAPPAFGIFDRVASYLSSYNFWAERPKVPKAQPIETGTVRWHAAEKKLKTMQQLHERKQHAAPATNHNGQKPIHFRKPLPYHYPVPMRPVATHLNTPRRLEDYLQNNPKWADLAAKVGRLMLNNEKTPQLEKQLRSALEKAMSQDEDLKKLINSVETLK